MLTRNGLGVVSRSSAWPATAPLQRCPCATHKRRTTLRVYSTVTTTTHARQKTHYSVLGVPETASMDTIKGIYRRLCKTLHPDVNPEAEEHFIEVKHAYEVLTDGAARASYDQELKQQRLAAVVAAATSRVRAGTSQSTSNTSRRGGTVRRGKVTGRSPSRAAAGDDFDMFGGQGGGRSGSSAPQSGYHSIFGNGSHGNSATPAGGASTASSGGSSGAAAQSDAHSPRARSRMAGAGYGSGGYGSIFGGQARAQTPTAGASASAGGFPGAGARPGTTHRAGSVNISFGSPATASQPGIRAASGGVPSGGYVSIFGGNATPDHLTRDTVAPQEAAGGGRAADIFASASGRASAPFAPAPASSGSFGGVKQEPPPQQPRSVSMSAGAPSYKCIFDGKGINPNLSAPTLQPANPTAAARPPPSPPSASLGATARTVAWDSSDREPLRNAVEEQAPPASPQVWASGPAAAAPATPAAQQPATTAQQPQPSVLPTHSRPAAEPSASAAQEGSEPQPPLVPVEPPTGAGNVPPLAAALNSSTAPSSLQHIELQGLPATEPSRERGEQPLSFWPAGGPVVSVSMPLAPAVGTTSGSAPMAQSTTNRSNIDVAVPELEAGQTPFWLPAGPPAAAPSTAAAPGTATASAAPTAAARTTSQDVVSISPGGPPPVLRAAPTFAPPASPDPGPKLAATSASTQAPVATSPTTPPAAVDASANTAPASAQPAAIGSVAAPPAATVPTSAMTSTLAAQAPVVATPPQPPAAQPASAPAATSPTAPATPAPVATPSTAYSPVPPRQSSPMSLRSGSGSSGALGYKCIFDGKGISPNLSMPTVVSRPAAGPSGSTAGLNAAPAGSGAAPVAPSKLGGRTAEDVASSSAVTSTVSSSSSSSQGSRGTGFAPVAQSPPTSQPTPQAALAHMARPQAPMAVSSPPTSPPPAAAPSASAPTAVAAPPPPSQAVATSPPAPMVGPPPLAPTTLAAAAAADPALLAAAAQAGEAEAAVAAAMAAAAKAKAAAAAAEAMAAEAAMVAAQAKAAALMAEVRLTAVVAAAAGVAGEPQEQQQ